MLQRRTGRRRAGRRSRRIRARCRRRLLPNAICRRRRRRACRGRAGKGARRCAVGSGGRRIDRSRSGHLPLRDERIRRKDRRPEVVIVEPRIQNLTAVRSGTSRGRTVTTCGVGTWPRISIGCCPPLDRLLAAAVLRVCRGRQREHAGRHDERERPESHLHSPTAGAALLRAAVGGLASTFPFSALRARSSQGAAPASFLRVLSASAFLNQRLPRILGLGIVRVRLLSRSLHCCRAFGVRKSLGKLDVLEEVAVVPLRQPKVMGRTRPATSDPPS